jgi:hypothetical protein
VVKKLNCKTGHRWAGWLHAATLTAGVALASTAQAQDAGTIQGTQSGTVTMSNPTRTATLRTTNPIKRQHWISHEDCVNDVKLTFRVNVAGADPTKLLVAYVGIYAPITSTVMMDSCLYNPARNDISKCLPLDVQSKGTGQPVVIVSAKTLTKSFGITNCGDDVTSSTPENLSLQFYFLHDPGVADLTQGGDYVVYEGTGIDLWGPAAPSGVTVTAGDEELLLGFASASSTDLASFNFYSDNGTGVADGGTHTTAASGGSNTTVTTGGASTSATTTTGAGVGGATSTSAGAGTTTSAGVGGAGGASTSSASSSSTGTGGSSGVGGMSTSSAASTSSASSTSTASGSGGSGGIGGAGGFGGVTSGGLSAGVTGSGNTDVCNPTAAAPVCTPASNLLVAGQVPDYDRTGSLPTVGSEGTITGLENGKAYVVAVAAVDDVGNVGKLSDLQCGTPQPVISILRAYECAGGFNASGCGFCSVGGDRSASTAALVSAGLFVFGFAVRRSRRPRVASGARGAR